MSETPGDSLKKELAEIEQSLDQGNYKIGQWQRFLGHVCDLEPTEVASIESDITRVSNKLHRRHHYFEIPFVPGLIAEACVTLIGFIALFGDDPFIILSGVVLLAIGLQPTIKISVGMLLGIRYSYVYLLNVEPRFKMRYGSYMMIPQQKRILYHLSGAVGTPAAMLFGYLVFKVDFLLLANACMVFFMLAALMQVGAFTAVWFGYRKIGGYVLTNLTSPATAAAELKNYMEKSVHSHTG